MLASLLMTCHSHRMPPPPRFLLFAWPCYVFSLLSPPSTRFASRLFSDFTFLILLVSRVCPTLPFVVTHFYPFCFLLASSLLPKTLFYCLSRPTLPAPSTSSPSLFTILRAVLPISQLGNLSRLLLFDQRLRISSFVTTLFTSDYCCHVFPTPCEAAVRSTVLRGDCPGLEAGRQFLPHCK